ncbi:SRPBCC domain-containing protein [Jidongwangia harbinensis]|uniref:SRPBCC domain-containing protein n=1 Tax=Jidongwangia harbinensis TaxID=2878561 RepID=UPI001CD948D9|nr:SRPBCC domain-containing protein [Jidongwangia harbinensis]MCA2218276.1 SRPBCC domain-containing protein [Jidongwangia harbinensis]
MSRSCLNSVIVAADRERIWTALTDPAELNRWETTDAHLDLRVGGGFLYEYAYGPSRPGTFLVVDPPRRLIQDNLVFNHNTSYHFLNTVELRAAGAGTEVSVLVEGYGDDPDQQWLRESMDLGWATDLQVLKAYVERGEDIRPIVWKGLRMGLRYTSAANLPTAAAGSGVVLLEVFAGSPAEQAGLRAGDVVTAVDGRKVEDFRGFREQLADHRPGGTATFSVIRGGEHHDRPLTFGDAQS